MCGNEQVVIFKQKNEQFENFSFFINVSDEEKFLLYQYGEITVNQRCCLIGMLDARVRFYDNIDPNWAIEVCKWSVTITICSFPYTGKSKELDDVTENQHMRWYVVQIIHHIIEPISMVNTIYCNNWNGYFSPLRRHRIINIWSILTNEVSKLLWFNFLLHAVITFE